MTRVGWRVKLGGVLTLVAVAAAATVLLVNGATDAPSSTGSHRGLAGREASRLIAAVALPGAVEAITSGSETGSALAGLGRATAPDTVQRSGAWSVPEPVSAVRAFLAAHPPRGTRPARGTALRFVPIHGRRGLAGASLALTVLPAGPRASTVHAEALVHWLVPRSSAERVPAAARELEITRGPRGRAPSLVIDVTTPARIARVRALLDRLPPVQPGRVYHCPAQFPEVPVVSFIFRSGGSRPRVLAVASEQADARSPTTACDAMRVRIAGRAQTPLLGGHRLLRQVSALLGRRLWTAPYAA